MAKGAYKKQSKLSKDTYRLYLKINLIISLVFFTSSVFKIDKLRYVTPGIVIVLLETFLIKSIASSIKDGYSPTYYQDALFISWFVHLTSIYSVWTWLFFLIIPAYALYKLSSFLCMGYNLRNQMNGSENRSQRRLKK
ncbi:hypothetical protein MHBO_001706 [Bonamia ostreae]|uniref:Uncharacterized protein n=1 Tax=Bonamia ostreae TaxID=126728 RepID=A0ABV2AJX5_9EUKA